MALILTYSLDTKKVSGDRGNLKRIDHMSPKDIVDALQSKEEILVPARVESIKQALSPSPKFEIEVITPQITCFICD
jgi:hypothetical protein